MINIHIVTLFPKIFEEYFKASIVGRAIKEKRIKVTFYNPIDFSTDKNKRVDEKPYGGGPGMVLQAEPFLRAYSKAKGSKKNIRTIFLSPSGKNFDNKFAKLLSLEKNIIFLCGHYEGIDERVKNATNAESVSVGDAILTGGEIPALYIVDALSRLIPKVLGNECSIETKRVASDKVYTRPESIKYKGKEYCVPKILLSGHHSNIEKWKKNSSVAKK